MIKWILHFKFDEVKLKEMSLHHKYKIMMLNNKADTEVSNGSQF